VGLVYLIHLHRPYIPYPGAPPGSCASHYTGRVFGGPRALLKRLKEHGTPRGSPLLLAAREAGITWELARLWPGGSLRERQLKRQGSARRYCPSCGIVPRETWIPLNRDGSVSRSLTTDEQKNIAKIMTAAQLAEHTALRKEVIGQASGVVRVIGAILDDEWSESA
jgi:hypothetical protein